MYTHEQKEKLIAHLSSFVTHQRLARMHAVLANRTRYVTVVLEDLYQSHNISAVLRSSDCFGVQDVHILEQSHRYSVNQAVAKGAAQWLKISRSKECSMAYLEKLKRQGYVLVATTPHNYDYVLEEVPLNKKIALIFGTEEAGLSDEVLAEADMHIMIPMFGFTESFNISVSVALCLQSLITRLHASEIAWKLSEEDKRELLLEWLHSTVRGSSAIEKQFFNT